MKKILSLVILSSVMFSSAVRAENDFFDDLIIDSQHKKQIKENIQIEEGKVKASELLDKKLMDLKFEQKRKEAEEKKDVEPEPDPAELYEAAPFGLFWLAPIDVIKKIGVVLTPKSIKDSPNSYTATNLPKPVKAFESVIISFGETDLLWRIAGQGVPMEDDSNASKGLSVYHKFYNIFKEKYGFDEEFYTAASVNVDEEVMLKDGSKSHIIKQKFIEKGDEGFKQKLMTGESVLYATFKNNSVSVTLALMANGDGQTFIMVDYKSLKINDLEHEKMLDAL